MVSSFFFDFFNMFRFRRYPAPRAVVGCSRALRPQPAVKSHEDFAYSGRTNADDPAPSFLQRLTVYAIIRHTKPTASPRCVHDHSSSPRACATLVLNDVLSSTQWKPLCSSLLIFTPMDPDIAADSPDGCTGHGPVLAPGSLAVRKREPRRLRQE